MSSPVSHAEPGGHGQHQRRPRIPNLVVHNLPSRILDSTLSLANTVSCPPHHLQRPQAEPRTMTMYPPLSVHACECINTHIPAFTGASIPASRRHLPLRRPRSP
ncbi:hypothetical protein C8F01DRAFT_1248628 [Mycena amicta]|nr:hypothetical protein C8F01DRAFT_1248628 [Mycena amicta]